MGIEVWKWKNGTERKRGTSWEVGKDSVELTGGRRQLERPGVADYLKRLCELVFWVREMLR